ncbi:hypothetical protein BHE74_00030982 [Ensete ventricosum]|nr:hypothetical protein BHE74_00030982 [Ensete ventricosum]
MRVDFPRREEGDLTGWLSYSERYFRYYRTPEASMVDIAVIHLEGDTIQWFEILSNLARDWSDEQLLGTFIEGLKLKIREVKARQPSTFMAAISFARIQEERLNQDARRTRTTPRPATYKPSAPSAPSRPSLPKKLTIEELRDRSTKGLCWHCDEPWSRDYRCKKGRLLLIEPIEDSEKEVQEHEEEVMGEEQQPTDCMMHALASYANPFDVKVADSQILKCDRRCSRVKLLLQDHEIIADFFLLPLDDYEAVLGIE